MDHIAVISDIHGNIPALEAVLNDIHRREIKDILCLGDLIGKGPHSPEAVDRCRASCRWIVYGNWDNYVSAHNEPGNVAWYRSQLGAERLTYLGALPFAVELLISGRHVRFFHAHPRDVYKRVHPTSAPEDRLDMLGPIPGGEGVSDVAVYGDIHHAYIQSLSGGLLVNAGSVGNPLDFPLASYLLLHGNLDDPVEGALTIDFIRIPYDIELAVEQAVAADMPECEAYVRELRTARYRGRS